MTRSSTGRPQQGLKGNLFLLSSRITYHNPALSDIAARSRITEDFVKTRRGNFKASVHVEVSDRHSGELCAVLEGAYVIKADTR